MPYTLYRGIARDLRYRFVHMRASLRIAPFARVIEAILCSCFIASRVLLWLLYGTQIVGWDVRPHLVRVATWPWETSQWDLASSFYAYHPPLAFILPRILTVHLGLSPARSAVLVAAICSLVGFLFLRAALARRGFLDHWSGILFLYITSSLPIQIYLARSINMDVVLYMEACMVLYATTLLIGRRDGTAGVWPLALLTLALFAALLTKYSGVLLLFLPPLILVFDLAQEALRMVAAGRMLRQKLCGVCIASMVAVLLATPYYLQRNIRQSHMVFPTNLDLPAIQLQLALDEREERDRDLRAFFVDLFWGTSEKTAGIESRDQRTLRMMNTWKDLWSANKHNIIQSALSLWLSSMYARIAPLFLLAGMVLLVIAAARQDAWDRFGHALVAFALMQLAALIFYAYRYPHPLGITNKAIYISPGLLGFGFVLTRVSGLLPTVTWPQHPAGRLLIIAGVTSLCAFTLANCVLPVY